jgi:hypothetical protein
MTSHRASPFRFALAIVWALLGAVASLPWLGINTEIAILPLALPAVPLYAIENHFSAEHVIDGLLWGSGHSPPLLKPLGMKNPRSFAHRVPRHSPPLLKPLGIAVVYFIPATLGVIWSLWGAFVPRKTQDQADPIHRAK